MTRENVSRRQAAGQLAGRSLLGAVLLYFGTGELLHPLQWVGYIPKGMPHLVPSLWMILSHGWILFVLGAFLVIGLEVRRTAAVSALVLLSVIGTLVVQGGVTSILVRDAGLFGLAAMIAFGPDDAWSLDALIGARQGGRVARASPRRRKGRGGADSPV